MSVIICVQKRLPPGKWIRRPGGYIVNADTGKVLESAGNPYHEPAGTEKGGQFAHAPGSSAPKFTSIKDAEDWAKDNIAHDVDFKLAGSLDDVQTVVENVSDLLKEYDLLDVSSITGARKLSYIHFTYFETSATEEGNGGLNFSSCVGTATHGQMGEFVNNYGLHPYHSMSVISDVTKAVVFHEIGHLLHMRNKDMFNKMRKIGERNEQYEVTGRASDGWFECIAENFAIYKMGRLDLMHPDMVKAMRSLRRNK
jgi:hypothetical protein